MHIAEIHTKYLFTIEICDDGTYYAVRDESPYFCLHGKTIEDATQQAIAAFEAYKKLNKK